MLAQQSEDDEAVTAGRRSAGKSRNATLAKELAAKAAEHAAQAVVEDEEEEGGNVGEEKETGSVLGPAPITPTNLERTTVPREESPCRGKDAGEEGQVSTVTDAPSSPRLRRK